MKNFNLYAKSSELALLEQFITKNGTIKPFKKKEPFITEGDKSIYVGFVKSGLFRYVKLDDRGTEHIIGFAFPNEYVAEYHSYICKIPSLLTIEAAVNSVAYVLPLETLRAFWETDRQTQRLRSMVAEKLYAQYYERVISLHCDTAEERYVRLIQQHPEVTNELSLKDIASYISVTPETVSHIRKKITTSRIS